MDDYRDLDDKRREQAEALLKRVLEHARPSFKGTPYAEVLKDIKTFVDKYPYPV